MVSDGTGKWIAVGDSDPRCNALPATTTGISYPAYTLSINNRDNFDASNSLLFSAGTNLTGTATAKANSASGQIAPFSLYIPSDTMDTCVASGGACTYDQGSDVALIVHHIKAGHSGGRNTLFTRTFVDGTPTVPPTVGYTGAAFVGSGNVNLTGTSGSFTNYNGSLIELNANEICQSGATFLAICNAQENDVALAYGASAGVKHALVLTQSSNDGVNGDYESAALGINSLESARNLTFTGDVQGLTSGTLTAAVTNGSYNMVFGNHEQRSVVVTGGTNVDWSADAQGALLTGTAITTAGFDAPWNIGINFGSYAAYPAFYDNSTLIAMQTPASGPLNQRFARAGIGIDWSNVTFHTAEFRFPGLTAGVNGELTASTLTLNPVTADKSAASWGVNGIVLVNPGTFQVTDTTSSGTLANEAMYALAPITEAATNATTITSLSTLYVPAPLAGSNVTATNIYGINTNGAIKASAGASLFGGTIGLNVNSNNATNIGTGTTTSNVVLGGGSNVVVAGSELRSGGTTFTLGTGTGACASTSTLTGGVQAGSFLCTGTAGASTIIINLPTASNGWSCWGSDVTAGTTMAQTTPATTTTCKLTGTIATTSDKVIFGALAF